MKTIRFTLPQGNNVEFAPEKAVGAGFTGRNQTAVRAHIAELERQGIPPPKDFPILFPLIPQLLWQGPTVPVIGPHNTPEVEPVLLFLEEKVFLTVGSDQTDRALEATHLTLSKNTSPKPLANAAWPIPDVLPHWDRLTLEARTPDSVIQRGLLSELLPYPELERLARRVISEQSTGVCFCGTIPTQLPWPPSPFTLTLRLFDPILNRSISHSFILQILPERY